MPAPGRLDPYAQNCFSPLGGMLEGKEPMGAAAANIQNLSLAAASRVLAKSSSVWAKLTMAVSKGDGAR